MSQFSYHLVRSGDRTWVIWLVCKHLFPLSYLTGSANLSYWGVKVKEDSIQVARQYSKSTFECPPQGTQSCEESQKICSEPHNSVEKNNAAYNGAVFFQMSKN